MADDDLTLRVRRIYAAVGEVEETDMSKFAPQVVTDGHGTGIYQDWSGDLSEEEVANAAYTLIHNVSNLQDHLRKWAAHNGQDPTQVNAAFDNSLALQIIKDLSNNDKHGYPPRGGGYSGKSPKVGEITRVLRLTTEAREGSSVAITFTPEGTPRVLGAGSGQVVITGDILDRDGHGIGDLNRTALQAIEAWENVLDSFGVDL